MQLNDRYNDVISKYKNADTPTAFRMLAKSLLSGGFDQYTLDNSDYTQGFRHGVDTVARIMLTLADDMKS